MNQPKDFIQFLWPCKALVFLCPTFHPHLSLHPLTSPLSHLPLLHGHHRCHQAHAPSPLSLSSPLRRSKPLLHHLPRPLPRNDRSAALTLELSSRRITCKATEVSVAEEPSAVADGENWVPVVPLSALPKGERHVIIQDEETILLLWLYTKFMWNERLFWGSCKTCKNFMWPNVYYYGIFI